MSTLALFTRLMRILSPIVCNEPREPPWSEGI
jgi:hypothetical protein